MGESSGRGMGKGKDIESEEDRSTLHMYVCMYVHICIYKGSIIKPTEHYLKKGGGGRE
jgi:hypothetical protein